MVTDEQQEHNVKTKRFKCEQEQTARKVCVIVLRGKGHEVPVDYSTINFTITCTCDCLADCSTH